MICQVDNHILKIDNLQKNTTYSVVGQIFTGNFEMQYLLDGESFTTLANDMYVPNTISSDTIKIKYSLKEGDLFTLIEWEATEGEYFDSIEVNI